MLLFIFLTAAFHTGYAQEISRITMQPIKVFYITDTALATEDISPKMGQGCGTLFMLIGQQQLKPGTTRAFITP